MEAEFNANGDYQFKPLSRAAVKHLNRAIKVWEKDPRKLDMNDWTRIYDKTNPRYTKAQVGEDFNSCGTVGCVAGWVCLNEEKNAFNAARKLAKTVGDECISFQPEGLNYVSLDISGGIPKRAAELLEINSIQEDVLFYHNRWPTKFYQAYEKAKTPRGRARATINLLKFFIKLDGDVLKGEFQTVSI